MCFENLRLHRDLAEIRRLVDANIIGVFVADFEGRVGASSRYLVGWMTGNRRARRQTAKAPA
jgi:hypothetical protein